MVEYARKNIRVHAPLLCCIIGRDTLSSYHRVSNISLGGLRAYADDAPQQGDRVRVRLHADGHALLELDARAVWVESLTDDAPNRHVIGFEFVAVSPLQSRALQRILGLNALPTGDAGIETEELGKPLGTASRFAQQPSLLSTALPSSHATRPLLR